MKNDREYQVGRKETLTLILTFAKFRLVPAAI